MRSPTKPERKELPATLSPAKPRSSPGHFWRGLLIVCALIAGGGGLANGGQGFEAQAINFDACESGKLPAAFSTALTGGGAPVSWVVRDDATAPNSKKVLVQESSDHTSYRFPLCIYDHAVASDVAVEVNFKTIAGKVDQAGGIVLRYRPENYYIARANALENNVVLFKTVNGKRSTIKEASATVTPGEWHVLRFEAKGPHLKVSFGGKVVIETDDSTFSQPGKIGLWTKADSVSAFTDLKLDPAP